MKIEITLYKRKKREAELDSVLRRVLEYESRHIDGMFSHDHELYDDLHSVIGEKHKMFWRNW